MGADLPENKLPIRRGTVEVGRPLVANRWSRRLVDAQVILPAAGAAALSPAIRAARIDPLRALRRAGAGRCPFCRDRELG